MAPTSGPGWVRNTGKQSESGRDHLGLGMGPGRAQDRTQARVWMAHPRDSNRLLGLSDFLGTPEEIPNTVTVLIEMCENRTENVLDAPSLQNWSKTSFRHLFGTTGSVTLSGRVRPRQRNEICNFGAPSPLDVLSFLRREFKGQQNRGNRTESL